MSDDEAFPVEGPQVAKSLRTALECPVCMEYMGPPITMCSSGHSVCGICRPRLSKCPTCRQPMLGARNFVLENLSRELKLPLKLPTEAPPAEPECPYEPDYGCPMECPWIGSRSDIRNHVAETHSDKLLDGTEENSCRWKLPLIVRDTRIMFAFGEVFRYRQRLHTIKKTFFIVVQYVGPEENASRYKYEVELYTSTGGQRVTVMGSVTLGYQQDIDAAYESGNCITLDYDVVKNVAEGNQLIYSVRVFKSVSTLQT